MAERPPPSEPLPPPKKARTATAVDELTTVAPAATPAGDGAEHAATTIGGHRVSAIGLGTLPLGVVYPDAARVPDAAGVRAVVAAATSAAAPRTLFVDTGDTYCEDGRSLHSLERVLAEVPSAGIALATKTGMARVGAESTSWRPGNTSPAGVAAAIAASCAALGAGAPGKPLFLWQLHHTDAPSLVAPGGIEASLDAVWPLVREGRIANVGICNATVDMLHRAAAAARAAGLALASVQNECVVAPGVLLRPAATV